MLVLLKVQGVVQRQAAPLAELSHIPGLQCSLGV